jgi:hypothetical protein
MKPVEDPAIVEDITNWVKHVSSTKTSNGWPICPYAQNALVNKRLRIFHYNFIMLDKIVDDFLQDQEPFKVWVFICDPTLDIQAEAKTLNAWYHRTVWLWDKAQDSGEIDGTPTGNGKYDVMLLQDRDELQRMSDNLREKEYYSNWSPEYYQQIVAWRTDANKG